MDQMEMELICQKDPHISRPTCRVHHVRLIERIVEPPAELRAFECPRSRQTWMELKLASLAMLSRKVS